MPAGACPRVGGGGHDHGGVIPAKAGIQHGGLAQVVGGLQVRAARLGRVTLGTHGLREPVEKRPRMPAGAHRASAPAARWTEIRTPATATPARATPGADAPQRSWAWAALMHRAFSRSTCWPARAGAVACVSSPPCTTPVSCAQSSPTLGRRRPQTPRTGPAPARPRRGHRVTPGRGPGGPLTVRSESSSIDGECRQGRRRLRRSRGP